VGLVGTTGSHSKTDFTYRLTAEKQRTKSPVVLDHDTNFTVT